MVEHGVNLTKEAKKKSSEADGQLFGIGRGNEEGW